MKRIRAKNWTEFQHYKDRSPIWIKLHKRLLDDYDFQSLPVASRALAPMLWLLASDYDGGEIPADTRKISFRLRMTLEELAAAFEPLLKGGFFEIIGDDSDTLAEPERDAIPEKEIQVTSKTQGTSGEEESAPQADAPPSKPKPVRGTRWSKEDQVPSEWVAEAEMRRVENGLTPINLRLEAERFVNYWASKAGVNATKVDWHLTWMNWALDDKKHGQSHGAQQRKPTATDSHLAGIRELIEEKRRAFGG